MKDQHDIIKEALRKGVPIETIARKLDTYSKKIQRMIKRDKELQVARNKYLTMVENIFET